MSRRLLVMALLLLLLVGGLVAGAFAAPIQHALTLPASPRMQQQPPQMGGKPKNQPQAMPTMGMPAQMPTNMLAQDNFRRGDQKLWGIASDGRTWEGDANLARLSQVFFITTSSGRIAHGKGTFNALLGPNATNVEVFLTGSMNQFTNGVNLGAVLRWNNNDNWYKALIDGKHLIILSRINGVTTQIGATTFQARGGVAYSLRFRAIGAMLFARVWRNDTPEPANWMLTANDMNLTAGRTGVRVLVQDTSVVTLTAFSATTASTAITA